MSDEEFEKTLEFYSTIIYLWVEMNENKLNELRRRLKLD